MLVLVNADTSSGGSVDEEIHKWIETALMYGPTGSNDDYRKTYSSRNTQ